MSSHRSPITGKGFRSSTTEARSSRYTKGGRTRRYSKYSRNTQRGMGLMAIGRPSRFGELKCFDLVINSPTSSLPIVSTAAGAEPAAAFTGITELNDITQGAAVYQRVGTKVVLKSVEVGGVLQIIDEDDTHTGQVRLMVVYDRQPNGAFPTMASILSDNVTGAPAYLTCMNIANRSRYLILRDQLFDIDIGGHGQTQTFKIYTKCSLDSEYGATAGTIGDLTTGALYLVMFAMSAGDVELYSMHSRVRYLD